MGKATGGEDWFVVGGVCGYLLGGGGVTDDKGRGRG